ncbi:MAG: putative transporter, partial [Bacteroidales bacterium]
FVGILISALGISVNNSILSFVKEFGLILFIYNIGLQVGPGFFSSFKKGGVKLNLLATGFVLLGCIITYLIHLCTNTPLTTMVGVMSGAVTNTPGLGAAQQTLMETTGMEDPTIAMGYAVAYPLGVLGMILAFMLIKRVLKLDLVKERAAAEAAAVPKDVAVRFAVEADNPVIFGKRVDEIDAIVGKPYVVARICHSDGQMEIASSSSIIQKDDKLLIVAASSIVDAIVPFFGNKVDTSEDAWENIDVMHVSRKVLITKRAINGRTIKDLHIRSSYGINVTRIIRADVDLAAKPDLPLQIGDKLLMVGSPEAIDKVAEILGNSTEQLREPNLMPIFFGIVLGVLLGSIPIMFPGIPQPVRLGLAGGPLIIAILISRFGPKYHIVTYTTVSANKMMKEMGIALFLAAVGLGAGNGFVDTVASGGYKWIIYGFMITVLPTIIIAFIARKGCKLNYYQIVGLISGSSTNPPALAYSNSLGGSIPSVTYATVYPLTMFLRILLAQILILMAI